MSVDAEVVMNLTDLDCLERLTGWELCPGECRLWREIELLAWMP